MSRPVPEITIRIKPLTGDFAEDKDAAATLRERAIRKALEVGQRVILDFTGVRVATQSFVHALISDVLRREGEAVLDRLVFTKCTKSVKGIVETVVQYSLESIEPEESAPEKGQTTKSKRRGGTRSSASTG
jgi:STAS-like domain of unknown function (DUF4325)